ncbi:hypothetical protein AYL99_02624 [Fonsecaea erecta]|uniref:Uncharacterized protein n=1 Tax=Fonsecaea erecta TaxID=1367422 RepID=A0A178ZUH1_9EURO|nr:hypothetical protein AYL99_02624 [Fonsecaea erecta]OAP63397.1 hypothetical protein AYL99_02624 [Fonsecaea erecta]
MDASVIDAFVGDYGNDNIDDSDHLSERSADEGSDHEQSDAGGGDDVKIEEDDDDGPKAQLLEHLQSELRKLTLEAETVLSRQPRSTQKVFAAETKVLFDDYKRFGSMARLKVGVDRFLKLGDEKGRLRIEKEEEKDKHKDDQDMTTAARQQSPSAAAAVPKRPAHYGEAFMLNDTEDDDKIKFDPELAFPQTRCTDNNDHAEQEEEHLSDLENLGFDFDLKAGDALPTHPLRTIDPDSIPYVTTLPWDPIATKVSWPDQRTWPKGLLGNLNKILTVEDAAARERLFHHVSKYGPAPVLRAGIAAQLRHEYSSIFTSAGDHYLGLSGKTRAFLRSVHTRHRRPALNVAERRLLALVCRVAEDSVQMFWEDAAKDLKAYHAMRIFMAAREIERDEHARKTEPQRPPRATIGTRTPRRTHPGSDSQSQARRADVLRDHIKRFNEFRRDVAGSAAGDGNAAGAST